MSIGSNIKKNLLWIILTATVIGCDLTPSQRDTSGERAAETPKLELRENEKIKKENKAPWTTVSEYENFVHSTVDKYFTSDIKEIYDFYSIKKDLPKYGFKQNTRQFIYSDCEGAVFKEKADSIYFYSTCLEYLFNRYIARHKNDDTELKEELTKRIHHSIKHEAAHDLYCEYGKEIGKTNLFKKIYDDTPSLEVIQYTLVEEGIADYISYKGQLTESTRKLRDEDFKEMIEKKDDSQVYDLGLILIKPILDINLKEGIKELIKNPLTKEDLSDLPGYRERIIANVLKEVEKK